MASGSSFGGYMPAAAWGSCSRRSIRIESRGGSQADSRPSRRRCHQPATFPAGGRGHPGLEYPGIVPLYGHGTYADRRPCYAMRLIRRDRPARRSRSVTRLGEVVITD
jgi:hypothetical protein